MIERMISIQEPSSPGSPPPLVVLVHGFLRTGLSMMPMALSLQRRGFEARVVSQFNLHASIPELADALYPRVLAMRKVSARRAGAEPELHFVTHSMGGIVVRSMLARHEINGLNRVVMLAPPNQGSRLAAYVHDELLGLPWGSFDPLRKLLPGERGDCVGVGDADAEIGIIAGASERSYIFPWSLGGLIDPEKFEQLSKRLGSHDGAVGLDEVRMDRATDMFVVQRAHTFMMAMPEVVEQSAFFLRTGRFQHETSA